MSSESDQETQDKLLRVLERIDASLTKLESHFPPDPPPEIENDQSIDEDGYDNLPTDQEPKIQCYYQISGPPPGFLEQGYYIFRKIDVTDQGETEIAPSESHPMEPGWKLYEPLDGPPSLYVYSSIPTAISNSRWQYYKPLWEGMSDDGYRALCHPKWAPGKHNFLPAWEKPNLEADYNGPPGEEGQILSIPYSSTPAWELQSLYEKNLYRAPFNPGEKKILNAFFQGLWTLPPDWRLDLDFQNHVLRLKQKNQNDSNILVHARRISDLLSTLLLRGGLYEVTDFSHSEDLFLKHTYRIHDSTSAAEAEAFSLKIHPEEFGATKKGFPRSQPPDPIKFNRLITIRGLAEVYELPPWKRVPFLDGPEDPDQNGDSIFQLHCGCRIRAHERLGISGPEVFHISWMEIQDIKPTTEQNLRQDPKNKSWKRHTFFNKPEMTIGKVAGSIRYFTAPTKSKKWWTILVLEPMSESPSLMGSSPSPIIDDTARYFDYQKYSNILWKFMTFYIHQFMQSASQSSIRIADEFEELLDPDDLSQILIEDDKFSRSQMLFWLINKIDEILPMITDAVAQWEWYRQPTRLAEMTGNNFNYVKTTEDPDWDWNLPKRKEVFDKQIHEIDKHTEELQYSIKRFEAMRERAKALRDGIFNLTSAREARESTLLGKNVEILTYLTVFYLPLAFCTSMWAINDMFGTGTRGYAIITVVISLGTYIVTIGLLLRRKLITELIFETRHPEKQTSRNPEKEAKDRIMKDQTESFRQIEHPKTTRHAGLLLRLRRGKAPHRDHESGASK